MWGSSYTDIQESSSSPLSSHQTSATPSHKDLNNKIVNQHFLNYINNYKPDFPLMSFAFKFFA